MACGGWLGLCVLGEAHAKPESSCPDASNLVKFCRGTVLGSISHDEWNSPFSKVSSMLEDDFVLYVAIDPL